MLYLADHPEGAMFWWQLAAGAGHQAAAYCLCLHHLSLGEPDEAAHRLHQLQRSPDGPSDEFVKALERFAGYVARRGSTTGVPTGGLEAEIERLVVTGHDGGLVCRPDQRLAERLHELAGRT
ncbi:hypothetical protein OG520_01125 [Streptomyces sp. NBC_00984]|uniref:hypothetical protein n=1 Tax=Streptomyces sp. NBC_00984 TaxID=2903700 RepID=UPI00386FDCB2|nr:hypothetical protein OG520_01125 [Streptomyces sp. NBC_00984]